MSKETKEKVKTDIAKRNADIAKRNGYEILEGTNRVISVLGNDSYIIENSYEGIIIYDIADWLLLE